MKSLFIGFFAVGILLTANAMIATANNVKDEATKKDREQIEGTWKVVTLVDNGKKANEEDIKKFTVVNGADGTWSLLSEGKEISKGTCTIDPTKKSKTIDITPTDGMGKDEKYLGIYELCKNTQMLCFAKPGKERPTKFASTPGSEYFFVTFQREVFTVLIDDVTKYLKQKDVPIRKGPLRFSFDGKIKERDGKRVIEARLAGGLNGFDLGYTLTGALKSDKPPAKELTASDLADIAITYSDDLLEAKSLTEKDVNSLVEQLKDSTNKVEILAVIIPGGEWLEFSPPMKKLIILGEKARKPLQECLGDKEIQNEVALILGAIGDKTTVPALIDVYPEDDISKAEFNSSDYMKGVCMTFALTYLTGQPIGRSRYGADREPGNKKLWKDWWAKEGKNFKVPATKPNDSWVPEYPVLTDEWAARCRREFAAGKKY